MEIEFGVEFLKLIFITPFIIYEFEINPMNKK